jgi:hypothetical protein
MYSQISFVLLVIMAGSVGFAGVSWLSAGAPVPMVRVTPMQPSPGLPTFAESVERGQRQAWTESKTSAGDNDPERDALRLELMQAANAYSMSPCSPVIKENLVKALTAYATAVAEKTGCRFMMCGGGPRVDAGAEMFLTPLDKRARAAVAEAFDKGGITVKDFPASLKLTLLMVTGGTQGDTTSACAQTAGRRS